MSYLSDQAETNGPRPYHFMLYMMKHNLMESDSELKELLKKTPNLCGGGSLIALVYCCGITVEVDGRERSRPCPIRDYALKLLGISKEKYREVKERHRLYDPSICYKNLAYCCSLLKECPLRDQARVRLGVDDEGYVEYKLKILRDLIPSDKLEYALSTRVIKRLAMIIFDVTDPMKEECTVWRAEGIGNPDLGLVTIRKVVSRELRKVRGEKERG